MLWRQKIWFWLLDSWDKLKYQLRKIKVYFWNKKILLWWYRLWLRKNEFHKSLDRDAELIIIGMNKREKREYVIDLLKRRRKAHYRDLAAEDKKFGKAKN